MRACAEAPSQPPSCPRRPPLRKLNPSPPPGRPTSASRLPATTPAAQSPTRCRWAAAQTRCASQTARPSTSPAWSCRPNSSRPRACTGALLRTVVLWGIGLRVWGVCEFAAPAARGRGRGAVHGSPGGQGPAQVTWFTSTGSPLGCVSIGFVTGFRHGPWGRCVDSTIRAPLSRGAPPKQTTLAQVPRHPLPAAADLQHLGARQRL